MFTSRALIPSLFLIVSMAAIASAAPMRTFTIQEPFGLDWGPDRVTYHPGALRT
jgi:hypothetical protein